MSKNTKAKIIMCVVIVSVSMVICLLYNISHISRNTYTATVTKKERIPNGDSSKYLIFTDLKSGDPRVFENTDSIVELKWNSSDVYAALKENKTYEIKTYGWRFPMLSLYENIIGYKEVELKKEVKKEE